MWPAIMVSQTSPSQPKKGCFTQVKYSMTKLIILIWSIVVERLCHANNMLINQCCKVLPEQRLSRKKWFLSELKVSRQRNSCQRFHKMENPWIQIGFQLSGTFSIRLRHRGFQIFNKISILLWLQLSLFFVGLLTVTGGIIKWNYANVYPLFTSRFASPWLRAQEMNLQIDRITASTDTPSRHQVWAPYAAIIHSSVALRLLLWIEPLLRDINLDKSCCNAAY